ncbi:hypothetical protein ACSAZK_16465 [Methanosarcina sp. Mfa9]|uniref:hypothetical protein n=1 Tax=Methanosarcina sp. Mfa9 TaxID=3439063 RepID=UPI003F8396A4
MLASYKTFPYLIERKTDSGIDSFAASLQHFHFTKRKSANPDMYYPAPAGGKLIIGFHYGA